MASVCTPPHMASFHPACTPTPHIRPATAPWVADILRTRGGSNVCYRTDGMSDVTQSVSQETSPPARGLAYNVAVVGRVVVPAKCSRQVGHPDDIKEASMLKWAAIFFVIAILAAVLGFGGIAAGASEIARILFFVFVIVFLVTLIMGMLRR